MLDDNLLHVSLILADDDRRSLLSELKDQERSRGHQAYVSFLDTKLEAFFDIFARYNFPIVVIKKNASLEVVSTVFTEINTQGQRLSAFDLCVAKFFQQSQGSYSLRAAITDAKDAEPALAIVDRDGSNFLQTIALLAEVGNKKAALPDTLHYDNIRAWGGQAFDGLRQTSTLLQDLLRVRSWDELPYDALVPPLACASLYYPTRVSDRSPFQARLTRWVVAAALKRRYTQGTDRLQAEDMRAAVPWVTGRTDTAPPFVSEPWTLNDEVRSGNVNSSRGKLLHLLLRVADAKDPVLGDQEWDSHHIFPAGYLVQRGISRSDANRFLNRTFIARATNQSIGAKAPSNYITNVFVPAIAARHDCSIAEAERRLREILQAHFIDDNCFSALMNDDYEGFIQARMFAFARFVESRFGLPFATSTAADPDAPVDEGDDDAE